MAICPPESFLKGTLQLNSTASLGFLASPDVTESDLHAASCVLICIEGSYNARYTCTGEDIEDNGMPLDRSVEQEIYGTQNILNFRARGEGGHCELHFELKK